MEEYFNIKPVVVLGITDIDDKIIEKSNKLKTDFKLLAKQYELDFFKDLNDLNILPPALAVRVSDHIPEVINFISKIIDKGHAYVVDDGKLSVI